MSKRTWIGLLLCLSACAALAEQPELSMPLPHAEMRLGDSSWYLYRPPTRSPAIYDIGYMMDRLRCDLPGYAVQFRGSEDFSWVLRVAPLRDSRDFVGPVYDMDIGATQLIFSFNF